MSPDSRPATRAEGLEGRARGVLALDRPVVERGVVLLGGEGGPLDVADAVDEVGRVEGGVRRHGDDAAGLRVEDDRRALLAPSAADWQPVHGRSLAMARPDCSACSACACTSMSRLSTRSSPGIGVDLVDDADRLVLGVDLDRARARRAAQVVLVDLLDAVLPDLVVERVRLRRVGLLLELLVDDLAGVAEHVGGELAVRVAAHRDPLGGDAGQLVGVLVDPDLQLLGHVAGDRHRHVGAVALVGEVGLEVLDRLGLARPGERLGQRGEDARCARRRRARRARCGRW